MYIYHALINALSAHMIHINLNMIVYTHILNKKERTSRTTSDRGHIKMALIAAHLHAEIILVV